jgi:hypothetical protein
MLEYSDLTIKCKQCGKDFIFSEDEQTFYKTRGFSAPQRCKNCRSKQRQSNAVCAECGSSFVEGAPVYCAACMINQKLARVPEPVIENQQILDQALERATLAEAAKGEAVELLREKAQEVAELKVRLELANSELEKSGQYRASLEKLTYALEHLRNKMSVLENGQKNMLEMLLLLTKKNEVASKNTLMEMLKGFFRPHGSPASSN